MNANGGWQVHLAQETFEGFMDVIRCQPAAGFRGKHPRSAGPIRIPLDSSHLPFQALALLMTAQSFKECRG